MERTVVYANREFPEPESQRSVDDSLFGDAPETDDKPASVVEEADAIGRDEQGPQGSEETEEQEGSPEDPRVVVSIKGGGAIIGVQNPRRTRTSRHSMTQNLRRLSLRFRR